MSMRETLAGVEDTALERHSTLSHRTGSGSSRELQVWEECIHGGDCTREQDQGSGWVDAGLGGFPHNAHWTDAWSFASASHGSPPTDSAPFPSQVRFLPAFQHRKPSPDKRLNEPHEPSVSGSAAIAPSWHLCCPPSAGSPRLRHVSPGVSPSLVWTAGRAGRAKPAQTLAQIGVESGERPVSA